MKYKSNWIIFSEIRETNNNKYFYYRTLSLKNSYREVNIMEEKNYTFGDPFILLSRVNMQLRDYFDSLSALCEVENIPMKELEERLEAIGYRYQPEVNQFKPL